MECSGCGSVQLRVLTTSGKGILSPRFVDKVKGLFGVNSIESLNINPQSQRCDKSSNSIKDLQSNNSNSPK